MQMEKRKNEHFANRNATQTNTNKEFEMRTY